MPHPPPSVACLISTAEKSTAGPVKGNTGACGIAGGLAEGAAPPEGQGWPAHLVHAPTSSLHFCTGHFPSCCSLQSSTTKPACFALWVFNTRRGVVLCCVVLCCVVLCCVVVDQL